MGSGLGFGLGFGLGLEYVARATLWRQRGVVRHLVRVKVRVGAGFRVRVRVRIRVSVSVRVVRHVVAALGAQRRE